MAEPEFQDQTLPTTDDTIQDSSELLNRMFQRVFRHRQPSGILPHLQERRCVGLCSAYENVPQFTDLVRQHLSKFLQDYLARESQSG